MKRLIVNADDLGLHPAINAGILRAHREGIVTSASLSPNGAAFDDAVQLLRDTPDLDLGVHLTLVDERALAGHLPTLAPDGDLPRDYLRLFARLSLGLVREEDVESELHAQLARVHDAGLRPTHVDGHQHVHLHPLLLRVVLRLAQRFGIRGVRAARRLRPIDGLRPALLTLFCSRGARVVRAAGLQTPDAFVGLSSTGRLDEAALRLIIAELRPGISELVCHPGADDGAIGAVYPWGFRWMDEMAALCSAGARDALAASDVSLVSYRDL